MAEPFSEEQLKVVREMIEKAVAEVSPKVRPSRLGKDPRISLGRDDQDAEGLGDLEAPGADDQNDQDTEEPGTSQNHNRQLLPRRQPPGRGSAGIYNVGILGA